MTRRFLRTIRQTPIAPSINPKHLNHKCQQVGAHGKEKRAQRLENYNQVHALRQQGYHIKDIAHYLGMGKRPVYTYLVHDSFPEWQSPSRQYSSGLAPYKSYLIEQWQQGKRHAKRLFEEIQQHGFTGSYAMVARYLQPLRQSYPPMRPTPGALHRSQSPAADSLELQWIISRRSVCIGVVMRRCYICPSNLSYSA
ncbi:MAG: hypothetical protein HC800_23200 [Phormidesmis sp. RL_2_1]|nr:hypothetical protein [Phormidesmis sp. RL_2_1]